MKIPSYFNNIQVVFIGMLLFSYFWGWMSDTHGRRPVSFYPEILMCDKFV